MTEPLSGVRDEAVALTRDALGVDNNTTSFIHSAVLRAFYTGGRPGAPGWFARMGADEQAAAAANYRFDLAAVKEGGLNVFGQSMLGCTSSSVFQKSNEYQLSVDLASQFGREGEPSPEILAAQELVLRRWRLLQEMAGIDA